MKDVLADLGAKFAALKPVARTIDGKATDYIDLCEVAPLERGQSGTVVNITRYRLTKKDGEPDENRRADVRHFTYHLSGSKQGTFSPVYRQGISLAPEDLLKHAKHLILLHNSAVEEGLLKAETVKGITL